jgi:N6-L-threonylcarbamoyladenine synthase
MRNTRKLTDIKVLLSVDTSCDDTSAAVTDQLRILSNVVSSQDDLHRQWGGVVPDLARRAHSERIDKVIAEALKRSGKTWSDIDAFAVTQGPGLAIALEVGIRRIRELAAEYSKPLIAVNHQEGHLLSALAQTRNGRAALYPDQLKFPSVGLVISGNTSLIALIHGLGDYEIIADKLDDAVGEAYDKVARMLGFGYPGGRVLSEFAKSGNSEAHRFPVPLAGDDRLAFSYSGLKTSVYYYLKKQTEQPTRKEVLDIAASFEKAAISHLQQKLELAVKRFHPKLVLLGGGVASSAKVRAGLREVCHRNGIKLYFPYPQKLYVDNAAMIGIAGFLKAQRGEFATEIDRSPRLPLADRAQIHTPV